jgi:PTS system galactitol-specific IIC component
MDGLLKVVNYIVALGANVFLPVIMFFIGLIFGLKPGKALRAGLTLGVAFTAINLFISQLLVGQIAPAAQQMIKSTGLSLTAMDVGWPAASTISWSWKYAATIFPFQIVVNLLLLWVGFTNTLTVDLWNVWQKIFAGAIIYYFTGNLWISYAGALLLIIIELKIGDLMAKRTQDAMGVPGVTIPHSCCTWLVTVTPLIYLLDRIPALNKVKIDAEYLHKKLGFLGDPIILGLILGVVIGLLGRFPFDQVLKLGVTTATVMLVLPRIASIFMEALMPISEAATEFMKKRFPGREVYIGLDWPVLGGYPAVITASVALIPVLILLAIILPGNTTLPFGDLANFGCLMVPAAVLTGGDLIKTLIVGIAILCVSLWGASAVAGSFTTLAKEVGFAMPENVAQITWLKTSPPIWAIFEAINKHWGIVIVLVALAAVSFYILKKYYSKSANDAD